MGDPLTPSGPVVLDLGTPCAGQVPYCRSHDSLWMPGTRCCAQFTRGQALAAQGAAQLAGDLRELTEHCQHLLGDVPACPARDRLLAAMASLRTRLDQDLVGVGVGAHPLR